MIDKRQSTLKCPWCKEANDWYRAVMNDGEEPADLDVSMCWLCLHASVYVIDDSRYELVKPQEHPRISLEQMVDVAVTAAIAEEEARLASNPTDAAMRVAHRLAGEPLPKPGLIRLTDHDDRKTIAQIIWPLHEQWPPPERVAYVVSSRSEVLTRVENVTEVMRTDPRLLDKHEVTYWRRTEFSKLTDEELADDPLLVRGAKYVLEGSDDQVV